MTRVKQRLLLLLAFCVVWTPVLVLRAGSTGDRLRESSEFQLAEGSREETLVGGREALYRMQVNGSRIGNPIAVEQVAPDTHRNPNRVRVLVLGDSFTFGQGAYDTDMRWWKRLEEELAARVGDGVFELVVIAQNGSSVVTHAGWVKGIVTGDRTVFEGPWSRNDRTPGSETFDDAFARVVGGPFDALLVGFVDNDVIVGSGGGFVPDTEVLPYDGLDIGDVTLGRVPNPNADLIEEAIAYMAAQFRDAPLLLLPLDKAASRLDVEYEQFPPYREHGFTVVDNPATERALNEVPLRERMINPVDEHPGPVLTRAYAVDAADTLATLLEDRVAEARRTATPPVRSLVSNLLPAEVSVEVSRNGATLRFTGVMADRCAVMMESGMNVVRTIECADGGVRPVFEVGGEEVPPQHLPCITLGRPHVAVWLDRMLPAGTNVTIGLVDGPSSGLSVQTVGYTPKDRLIVGEASTLSVGGSFAYQSGRTSTGFLLAHPDLDGCALENPLDSFPPFTVVLQVAS